MKAWQILFLFLLSFSFLIPSLLREMPFGSDSQYFLNHACGKGVDNLETTPLLAKAFFESIPCEPLLWKVIPSFIIFFCALFAGKMGELFHKEKGWMVGLFVFFSFAFIQQAFQFEDDVLAYPILYASLFFYMKAKVGKEKLSGINYLFAFGLLGLAGLFWKGAIFYLLVYAFGNLLSFLGFLLANFLFKANPITSVFININIGENVPFWGVLAHFIPLLIGFIYIPAIIMPETLIWLLFGFFTVKFSFHAVPFLAIGFLHLLEANKENKRLKNLLFLGSIVPLLSMVLIFGGFPQYDDLEMAQYVSKYSNGRTIINNWGLGYLIKFYGGNPANYGTYTVTSKQGLVVASERDLIELDFNKCEEIRKIGKWSMLEC